MGCASSHEEPPHQQPSNQKPTSVQTANLHPSINQTKKYPMYTQHPTTQPMTKESLSRYIKLEKEIHQIGGNNILKSLKAKGDALATHEVYVKSLEKNYKNSEAVAKKEKADVDMLNTGGVGGLVASNETIAQEKEEYIEALNRQEIAKQELDEGVRQRALLADEVEQIQKAAERVLNLMDEQEELLSSIFGGEYGSELENRLESEAEMLREKKRRIGVAKYKWQNGRVLVQYAVNQLAFAERKWIELKDAPKDQARFRYTLATETRNNLVAANQNITSAQRYLNTIDFPYCKPAEMETLQRAASNIYSDMQTPDRHNHAHNVYHVTHRRATALLQWFDVVINGTISKDFANAKKETSIKVHDLREERIRLIQEKIKRDLGETLELKDDHIDEDEDEEDSQKGDSALIAMVSRADGETDVDKPEKTADDDEARATPLPDNELAPPPNTEDLFGDINDLKKQHEKDMEEFQRQQELNKARIDQGLHEKLARRRSRKMKVEKA